MPGVVGGAMAARAMLRSSTLPMPAKSARPSATWSARTENRGAPHAHERPVDAPQQRLERLLHVGLGVAAGDLGGRQRVLAVPQAVGEAEEQPARERDDGPQVAAGDLALPGALRGAHVRQHQTTFMEKVTVVPRPGAVWTSKRSASFFTPRRPSPMPSLER